MTDRVLVVGPASWNRIVLLDRLPEPVAHTVVATDAWHTVGGTSAGKSLSLAGAGREVLLSTQLAAGAEGELVRSVLTLAGVQVRADRAAVTEQHLNLMTPAGERLSIYLARPPAGPDDAERDREVQELMAGSAVVVLDLGAEPRRLVPTALAARRPIWTDLHDYDGRAAFHQPFLEAADAVFMNDDATPDPLDLLARCLRHGAAFAVCTLGAEGAVALDRSGRVHRVDAVPAPVVDTNGAGDAFFAGTLDAHLAGAELPEALAAGARSAAQVLGSRHLHPALDGLLSAG
ncbi:sugar/nucleoside kinase (ribokinase family) [Nocardioides aromaticivorans]|uniref:Sugar/nucleoside kinase (Ribokinase family) n=1 Tax=Nocardioides aromaticivorans TaxID=200618 RepID=A0A7Z0CL24_9ACTN|nr:carbohydrate kinase family protein [Nocardioides aromaticivorans]NYI44789.1 sugar/nucleoside kinase (ribokinase family) [Nocardioides aromaticivorans]